MAKQSAKYKNDFYDNNYDNLRIFVPSGRKEDIKKYINEADHKYSSINAFVNDLIREKMGMSTDEWSVKLPKSQNQEDTKDNEMDE